MIRHCLCVNVWVGCSTNAYVTMNVKKERKRWAQQPLISISFLRLFVLRNRIERLNLMIQTIAVWKFRENFKYFIMTFASVHLQILGHFLRQRNVTQTKHWIYSLLSVPLFHSICLSCFSLLLRRSLISLNLKIAYLIRHNQSSAIRKSRKSVSTNTLASSHDVMWRGFRSQFFFANERETQFFFRI